MGGEATLYNGIRAGAQARGAYLRTCALPMQSPSPFCGLLSDLCSSFFSYVSRHFGTCLDLGLTLPFSHASGRYITCQVWSQD